MSAFTFTLIALMFSVCGETDYHSLNLKIVGGNWTVINKNSAAPSFFLNDRLFHPKIEDSNVFRGSGSNLLVSAADLRAVRPGVHPKWGGRCKQPGRPLFQNAKPAGRGPTGHITVSIYFTSLYLPSGNVKRKLDVP